MLRRLISRSRFRHTVVSLTRGGQIADDLRASGTPVHELGASWRPPDPRILFRLRTLIRREAPDVVKSWMYHADLAASMATPGKLIPIVWGVHNASLDPRHLTWTTRSVAHVCARISQLVPSAVVFDSQAGMEAHSRIGYAQEKGVVIANGFDTDVWLPRPGARAKLREELGVGLDVSLVGLIARFDPLKDHSIFLQAAARVLRDRPDTQFVLCGGTGIDQENRELMRWIDEARLGGSVHLLGRRNDLEEVVAALDIGVSSSRAESFPLAVGEMMSAGIPCVVTDVGDSAHLLGDGGLIVPARDFEALAAACVALLSSPASVRASIGMRGRLRIESLFSISATIAAYEELFQRVHYPLR